MKKQFPNLLSGGRLFLAGVMGILPVSGAAFAVLYLLCGLTDVLDGWLARRLRAESEFGAKLDSATDVCFLCVSLVRLWPVLRPGVPVLLFQFVWRLSVSVPQPRHGSGSDSPAFCTPGAISSPACCCFSGRLSNCSLGLACCCIPSAWRPVSPLWRNC